MENEQAITKLEVAFKKAMKALPLIIGNEVVNFSKQSFDKQGWLDSSFQRWPKRKGKKDANRAILIKTGRLKRSIRITTLAEDLVGVGTDVPYAKANNEGFTGRVPVKQHMRNRYSKTKVGSGRFTKSGKERIKTVSGISGKIEVKAHMRQMRVRKRQYLGQSQYLVLRLKRVAGAYILKQV